ncbi:MAG: phosphoglycerate kinase [Flammeovirgaceae bacterium TMED290]|nr:MAG: phosphoglycerate kinase [Flammeovirgaceae bacterium TMED290]
MDNIKFINSVKFNNKVAIVRVDFNVPLDKKLKITDKTRIKNGISSIKHIIDSGGRCIIISHLGRPKGIGYEKKFSLNNILDCVSEELKTNVKFIDDYYDENFNINNVSSKVILLENLRFYKEEKNNNIDFAKKLASFAEIYVNDAFGTCHREHTSINMLPKLMKQKCAGLLIQKELLNIDKIIKNHKKPFTAVLGGAKISDKIKVIEKFIELADNIIIGGAMSNTFIKAIGGKIGNSLHEKQKILLSIKILEKAKSNNVKIFLPVDSRCSLSLNDDDVLIFKSNSIKKNYSSFDIGPESIKIFHKILINSKTIIWNGPMGVFENKNFSLGTNEVAKSISNSTNNGSYSLVGGGDSVSAIKKNNKEFNISFISTGGGALLELISNGNLPSLSLLNN